MRILGKKWWTLAAALPVAALVACTSNSPVEVVTPKGQVYSEDEYEELVEQGLVDESGNVIEEDEEEGAAGGDANASSSSGSKTASSSDTKTESSSDSKTASSSDSKTTSSDSKTESSSSAKVSSDSGSDKSSSSASGDVTSSAGTGDVTVSSSSITAQHENTGCDSGECSIGTNAMDKVDAETKTELDSLKELIDNGEIPVGFEELPEGLTGENFNYNFLGENDVYCFTGEGEWLHVVREELGKYINHFKNG
ncbi:MAG: hypothetical protein IJ982_11600, partial [Fibrobacter sp.]|nr:hypothetical protein [Fibrobacter sp.]